MKSAILLSAGALVFAASCAVEVGRPSDPSYYSDDADVIYVRESPPPPRGETISGVAPGPNYVWVGGYWAHRPTGWAWVPGAWVVRPRPGVVWVPGHWESHPRGHVCVPGRWR